MTDQPPVGVQAQGWGWRHAGRNAWALRNLTFTIEPGERVLLLGGSGSGKSTLLQAMAGLLGDPSSSAEGDQEGALLVGGRPSTERRGLGGLLQQDPASNLVFARVGDEVAFGPENIGLPSDQIWDRVHESLELVGLGGLDLARNTSELSGGQQQRLALAGQLALAPGLLLLDEPTANLDPDGARRVRDAVAGVTRDRDTTMVVVEHRVEIWMDVVDRVIVLGEPPRGASLAPHQAQQALLADGDPASVFTTHADALRRAGVWMPGDQPRSPARQAAAAEVLLHTTDLAVGYQRAAVRSGINLELRDATSTVITGANGTGKTTVALTLAGLLAPVHGQVTTHPRLAGRAGTSPIRLTSRELLTRIGMVFQQPEHQFLTASVRDELGVGLRALGLPPAQIAARTDDLLARLRLDHLALAHPFTLSGGQKRRLSVATVLATQPQMVILDEPTFGQDRTTWAEMVELVNELVDQGTAMVSVSHDEAFISAVGSQRIELSTP